LHVTKYDWATVFLELLGRLIIRAPLILSAKLRLSWNISDATQRPLHLLTAAGDTPTGAGQFARPNSPVAIARACR
jgi:hypothetical protein